VRQADENTVNRKLNVAIIGTGFIADYHVEILRNVQGVKIAAACDPDAARLNSFCDRWSIARRARSIDELLAEDRPDAAHVLVPPALHVEATRKLLDAGVHVLLEKPMALSSSDAESLAALAATRSCALAVNHNWLHQPLFVRALADIAAHKIGPVRHILSVNSLPLFQLAAGIHDHWMFEQPTNILFEQAVHPLSQICRLIGPVEAADAVCADARVLRGGKPFLATWQISLCGAAATAQMSLSFGASFPSVRLSIIGQDGVIEIDQLKDLYTLDRRTRFVEPVDRFVRGCRTAGGVARGAARGLAGYGLALFRLTGRRDVYYLGMRDSVESFYQALRSGQKGGHLSENGLQTIDAVERIIENHRKPTALPTVVPAAARRAPAPNSAVPGKVVVFGANGFIGRKVVARLAAEGIEQRLFVRSAKCIADLADSLGLEVCVGDVTNRQQVGRAVEGCESIIHLVAGAPQGWPAFEQLFVGGLRNVADAALEHRIKKLLFASSITSLYLGRAGETITEQTPPEGHLDRRCDYAKAKILCEQLLQDLFRTQGLPAVILRPGIVIGEGSPVQHLGVGDWPNEITCMRWGRSVDRELPLVLVEDVAEAFYCALRADGAIAGKAFNLVGDVRLSAQEYIDAVRAESHRDFQLNRQSVATWALLELSKWVIKAAARKPENTRLTWRELKYRTAAASFDCRGTKQFLGWVPTSDRQVFLERGIRAALRGNQAT
jgi:predicted dehydrogenase/nucleoside-diphosphate-sugar epimerase